MTFKILTPKSIGVYLFLSSICVLSMKFVGWEIFELSHYNKVWTYRVITIGLPYLRWQGPNYCRYKESSVHFCGKTCCSLWSVLIDFTYTCEIWNSSVHAFRLNSYLQACSFDLETPKVKYISAGKKVFTQSIHNAFCFSCSSLLNR